MSWLSVFYDRDNPIVKITTFFKRTDPTTKNSHSEKAAGVVGDVCIAAAIALIGC